MFMSDPMIHQGPAKTPPCTAFSLRPRESPRAGGLNRLTTHASHLARRFFARHGWRVDYPETAERDGAALERFALSLDLGETDEKTNQS
jgi:hypothetical protein